MIARNITHETPVTDVVIKAVKTTAHEKSFQSLKFKKQRGVIFHDAGWIAGVDHNDNDNESEEDDNEEHHLEAGNAKKEDEVKEREQTDPGEVNSVASSDAREDVNPSTRARKKIKRNSWQHQTTKVTNAMAKGDKEERQSAESTRRSTRETSPPVARLEPTLTGKSHT